MKKTVKKIILLAVMAAWLLLMWRLSSADGKETLNDSMRLTRKIAALFWDNPTAAQLDYLNMLLRKMAHVFLYAVFGLMSAMFWQIMLEHSRRLTKAVLAMACCTVIAFLDELQKIPIAGRHFSCSESILNAVSAAAVILVYFLLALAISQKQHKTV